jgi:hypothetical protein
MIMQGIKRQRLSILKRIVCGVVSHYATNGLKVKILKHLPYMFYTENKTWKPTQLGPALQRDVMQNYAA